MFYNVLNNCKYYTYIIQNYINKKHEWRLCMGSLESMIVYLKCWLYCDNVSSASSCLHKDVKKLIEDFLHNPDFNADDVDTDMLERFTLDC